MATDRKILMANNQSVFRHRNEKVVRDMENLEAMCKEDNVPFDGLPPTSKLHFVCECSNDLCQERIVMSLGRYMHLHRNRSNFTICLKHELSSIESIAKLQKYFQVVHKNKEPIEDAKRMTTYDKRKRGAEAPPVLSSD